jgi:hypothetical protein
VVEQTLELLEVWDHLDDDRRHQVLWLAHQLADWQDRYPQ